MSDIDRMARLAGAMAHVFNNILHAIQVNASLLLETEDTTERDALVQEIQLACARAEKVTKKMLTASRQRVRDDNVEEVARELAELERFLWVPVNEAPAVRASEPTALDDTRRLRVLVVDDEDMTRRTTVRALKAHDFEVVDAASGFQALRALDADSFDIVVTDMAMPGMTGREMVQRMRPRFPHLPVVLFSGYSTEIVARDFAREQGIAFAQKPMSAKSLAGLLRSVVREGSIRRPG